MLEPTILQERRQQRRRSLPAQPQTQVLAAPIPLPKRPHILLQLETKPIKCQQLWREVQSIYHCLHQIEEHCIAFHNKYNGDTLGSLDNEALRDHIALQLTLLHQHYNFLLAIQHPSGSPQLRQITLAYGMPERLWKHGIVDFLVLLRHRRPAIREHLLRSIHMAFSMIALCYETVPDYSDTTLEDLWFRWLSSLAWYRQYVDGSQAYGWAAAVRYWVPTPTESAPNLGLPALADKKWDNGTADAYTLRKPCDTPTTSMTVPTKKDLVNCVFAGKYELGQLIGSGTFGRVYRCTNNISGERLAIKTEDVGAKHPTLKREARVYEELAGGPGIPILRSSGTEDGFNYIVIDELGSNLEQLRKDCSGQFTLKTALLIKMQLICRLNYVHDKGFIYRDMKPENILIGSGLYRHLIYLADYGLAIKYRDPSTGRHTEYCEGKKLTGSSRYISVKNHEGIQPSRRDDMVALSYLIIYLLRGSLPWQGLQGATQEERFEKILRKKKATSTAELCRGLDIEFRIALDYALNLGFDARPDYGYLYGLFRRLFIRHGFQKDCVFDWVVVQSLAKPKTYAAALNATNQTRLHHGTS